MKQEELIIRLKNYIQKSNYASLVRSLSLFGSYARNTQTLKSDVDLLVSFIDGAKISLLDMSKLTCEFEDVLNLSVDLATLKSLDEEIIDTVKKNLVSII